MTAGNEESKGSEAVEGLPSPSLDAGALHNVHPAGKPKYGPMMQILRGMLWATYFNGCCVV